MIDKRIYLVVALLCIVLIHRYFNKLDNSLESGAYTTTWLKDQDVLFSVPDNPEKTRSSQLMVIISGQYQSNPAWFFNHIPVRIRNKRYIVIGSWDTPVNHTLKYGREAMEKVGIIDTGISSISGFSAGGSALMDIYKNNHYGRVMILDPAISPTQEHKEYGHEVIFLYGSGLHDRYNTYADEYDTVAREIVENGGIVEEKNINHYEFPYYGFNKYENEL